jgi:uncharacterized protein (DUF58 family)
MNIAPDRRLVRGCAGLAGAALLVVFVPALREVWFGSAAVLAALVLWDGVLLRRQPGVRTRRVFPPHAAIGRAAEIVVVVENPGDRPAVVTIVDECPTDVGSPEPRFDDVPVPARGAVQLDRTARPARRGDRVHGPLVVLERAPLGLLRRRTVQDAGAVLAVYPDATRYLRPEALDPTRVLALLGVRPTRRRGDGLEFESLRDYVPGDDPRRVDWAASARRGRLVSRRYQHERHRTVVIAVDASRLMGARIGDRTKLDFAVDAALALAYAGLVAGDRMAMTVFDRRVRGWVPPQQHRARLGAFIELLRTAEPTLTEASHAALVRELSRRQRQRCLVVVLTDFVEVAAEALLEPLAVLGRRHRVLLVALRDPVFAGLRAPAPADDVPLGPYRRLALDHLLREREAAMATARRRGLQTLDLAPDEVTAAVLNRYLALRAQAG